MFHKVRIPACRRCKSTKMMELSGVAIPRKPAILHLSCEYAPDSPAERAERINEPPASYFLSTLGFTIDRAIDVDGATYSWVGSIFHSQAHFWCVAPSETDIWRTMLSGDEPTKATAMDVYRTGEFERELEAVPVSHFYAIEPRDL